MEIVEQILKNLADGEYDGFSIELPSFKPYRNGPTTSKWFYIKDGKIVQCIETASKFFDGKENIRDSEIQKTIFEDPGEIVEWLQKYGYKAYEHEDLRQFSKDFYNERDRLRELQRAAENMKEGVAEEVRPIADDAAKEVKEAVENIARETGKEAAQKGAKKAKKTAGNVGERARKPLSDFFEETKDFGERVFEDSKNTAANVVDHTKDAVVKTVEGTKDIGTRVIRDSKKIASGAIDKTKDAAGSAVKGAQKAIKDSADTIVQVAKNDPKKIAAGAGIAVGVAALAWGAVKMAPHVKKWWKESISPKFKTASSKESIPCPVCGGKMDDADGQWKCSTCGYSISEEKLKTEVFWFCDNCGSFLNVQEGFDDSDDTFLCKECGSLNMLTEEHVINEVSHEEDNDKL